MKKTVAGQSPAEIHEVSAAIVEPEEGRDSEIHPFTDKQNETYRDDIISSDLNESQKREGNQLLYKSKDIFTDVPAVTCLGKHIIELTSTEPIRGKANVLPHARREVIDKELDSIEKLGVIEPSRAAYASPIVIVKKSDGSNRACVDYRKLNKITIFDPEPSPTAEQIFAKFAGDKYFSKFDLSKGYWQILMREDQNYTTFISHRGLYQFRVMPFGLMNAPATCSRIMRKLLDNQKGLDNYLDDVLAHTST